MFCIGLTGEIASGKSTVSAEFAEFGITIINADLISKSLTQSNQPAFHTIVHHFGPAIVNPIGELDRPRLRDIITQRPIEREWLEQLLHPLIRKNIEHDIKHCQSAYCVIEIPLLISKTDYPYLNRVLLVEAPVEQQISRLMARDNATREQALAMLTIQPDKTLRQAIADDQLINDGNLVMLKQHVLTLHRKYLDDAQKNIH